MQRWQEMNPALGESFTCMAATPSKHWSLELDGGILDVKACLISIQHVKLAINEGPI